MASTQAEWHHGETRHAILSKDASREEWYEKSGMNHTLLRSKVRFATEHGQDGSAWSEYPGQVVILRSDNKAPMGIVSDGFKILQPRTVMDTTFDLCKEVGIEMETAGTLQGGRKYWALASIGKEAFVVPGDKERGPAQGSGGGVDNDSAAA
jgi:hypothetical protein